MLLNVKFLDDVPYTSGQQEIANQISNNGTATARLVDETSNILDIDGVTVVQSGSSFIINGAAKLASDRSLTLVLR